MAKRAASFFWGKFLFFCLFLNLIILNSAAANASAKTIAEGVINLNRTQSTTVAIETTGPVIYRSFLLDSPARLVLTFKKGTLESKLKEELIVNRGMVKKVYCRYYKTAGAGRWMKSITFILVAKTGCKIKDNDGQIIISILNTPEQSISSTMPDELVIKDYMPKGWGSAERKQAIITAIRFLRMKKQMARPLPKGAGINEPSVLVEKRVDNSVRITAANLTPVDMIATGAKVLLTQPVQAQPAPVTNTTIYSQPVEPKSRQGQLPVKDIHEAAVKSPADFTKVSLGFLFIMLGLLVVEKVMNKKSSVAADKITHDVIKEEKRIIEELFLKDEELQKWPKYHQQDPRPITSTIIETQQPSLGSIDIPAVSSDIAERRKFPRADIINTRGVINRALIGSKTQPFKNIRINDISKGGLSFLVKSKDVKFRAPTVIKLYFASSPKPLDTWVRVVWEKEDLKNDSKNVGVKFTRVPKETWEKIIESFGHRLG